MIRNGRERAKLALSGALIAAGLLFAAPAFAQGKMHRGGDVAAPR